MKFSSGPLLVQFLGVVEQGRGVATMVDGATLKDLGSSTFKGDESEGEGERGAALEQARGVATMHSGFSSKGFGTCTPDLPPRDIQ